MSCVAFVPSLNVSPVHEVNPVVPPFASLGQIIHGDRIVPGIFGKRSNRFPSIGDSIGDRHLLRPVRPTNKQYLGYFSNDSGLNLSSSEDNTAHRTGDDNDTNDALTVSKSSYILPYLRELFLMCRPVNFPVVTLFHVLGVHLAVKLWTTAAPTIGGSSKPLLVPLLTNSSMLMVLLSLLLVTSTSMITNDYYDARDGVDAQPNNASSNDLDNSAPIHYHPLAAGEIPFSVAKTFDSYLYAILLLSSAFVPGVMSRLMVLGGAIITYLYTVHLKPKTHIKNLSCAALVSMSPVTSGLAAWHVLCRGYINAAENVRNVRTLSFPIMLLLNSPLAYLVVSLFAGIMSREILMDITDCETDAQAGILTVPVKYGKDSAAKFAFFWSFVSGLAACSRSISSWLLTNDLGNMVSLSALKELSVTSFLGAFGSPFSFVSLAKSMFGYLYSVVLGIVTKSSTRNLFLSVIGSGTLLWRAYKVLQTSGEDVDLAEQAIRESLLSVLLVLASFV